MQIQEIGHHQRFVVIDDDGRYWSGPVPGWVPELRQARVFAERHQAEKVIRIVGQQMKDIETGKQFVAQVVVTTAADQFISLDELRATLERYVNVISEIEGDLLVLGVEIDWDTLEEREDV